MNPKLRFFRTQHLGAFGAAMVPRFGRVLPRFLIVPLLLLLLLTAIWRGGPDFGNYLTWARAFRQGDPQEILSAGFTLSPLGVPLTQWSHGPGLLFALCPPACQQLITFEQQANWTGWAFTVLFWWAMFKLLYLAAEGDLRWTVYGILVAAIGTQLGFYSRSYGSETFSQAFLAVMVYWVLSRREWRILDTLLVGCLASLLLINRAQLVIYALPLLAMMVWALWRTRATRSSLNTVALLVAPLLALLLGFLQVAAVNRWMTGNLLHSVYAFGNATFSSLDFRRPELLAVLIHPWHGLLSFHPFYMLGFITLLFLLFQSGSWRAKLLCAAYLFVILANVYLQASWYVWWLGRRTFGMRGVSLAGVILVPVLIRFMRQREMRNKSNALPAILVLVTCVWSAVLFFAALYGEYLVAFMTYGDLLQFYSSQVDVLRIPLFVTFATLCAILLAPSTISVMLRRSPGRFIEQLKASPSLIISLVLLAPAFLYPLMRYSLDRYAGQLAIPLEWVPYLALLAIPLAMLLMVMFLTAVPAFQRDEHLSRLSRTHQPIRGAPTERSGRGERVLGYVLVGIFIAANAIFVRFAVRIESNLSKRQFPLHQIQYVSSVYIGEVARSYREYLNVPGFQDKKAALLNFVTELQASAGARAQAEIVHRLQELPQVHIPTETPFGEDLVLVGTDLIGGAGDGGNVFHPGDLLGVTTYWQVRRAGRPQSFSLHLTDADGREWLVNDYQPQLGSETAPAQQTDGTAVDHRGFSLPSDLAPGQYTLSLTVFDEETDAFVSVAGSTSVSLAKLDLLAAPSGVP